MPSISNPKPECTHSFLRQTVLIPILPPLYIANPTHLPPSPTNQLSASDRLSFFSANLITDLERIYTYLGPSKSRPRCRPPAPRTSERNDQSAEGTNRGLYRGIGDLGKKEATELYLARYRGFVMIARGILIGMKEEKTLSTVLVFHLGHQLCSLKLCYLIKVFFRPLLVSGLMHDAH